MVCSCWVKLWSAKHSGAWKISRCQTCRTGDERRDAAVQPWGLRSLNSSAHETHSGLCTTQRHSSIPTSQPSCSMFLSAALAAATTSGWASSNQGQKMPALLPFSGSRLGCELGVSSNKLRTSVVGAGCLRLSCVPACQAHIIGFLMLQERAGQTRQNNTMHRTECMF